MRVVIEGHHLPGRCFVSEGQLLEHVHVGIQIGREPSDLVPADAPAATWELEVRVVDVDGGRDFRGPAVQGKRGDRFLYLVWGELAGPGPFHMFRRAKLMVGRVDAAVMDAAVAADALRASVHLTDDRGGPRCARVDPPAIAWTAG